ncbi:MAG: hypothetical protein Q4E13_11855 [Clostridia bacterium]|nr:hypothetical protein [Clostridia bacterium]
MRAHAREGLLTIEEQSAIEEAYYDALGERIPAIVCREVLRSLRMGMQIEVILSAMNDTALARRPTARYLLAILRRYQLSDILTADDLARDRAIHERHMEAERNRWRRADADEDPWELD